MSVASEGLNKARELVWPLCHRVLKTVSDAYAVTQTTEDEYVATARETQESLEARLSELGFERTPIASLKVRFDGNVSDGSWVYRDSKLADRQLHVVLHELADQHGVDVYAHVEDSWIRHPLAHLRKKSYSAHGGVSSVRSLLDREDEITWEVEPRYRRDDRWVLYFLHLVSKSAARRVHDRFADPEV